ncbi:glycerol-3-phosphate ABC transporter ATP-binding protein [Lactobacillus sp. CBA3606]|uniref:ABC transporter ATP-binding protein n=1 Tax=Lactobacillus sp. CBA3606 TaxID=2099789 RepID=UPI000CFCA42F|nr:ABC transporter ATP-binding protein [Lactobacillus sp. CBA3606]AVK62802.1 glycerol-3-phosphate ABC transporter ATP-binding protein [Lactobacillus sp. CBA3606]
MGIELRDVTKTYNQTEPPVLTAINAEIQDGELFVIVGPSGCGKSTLLRMIAGIIPISAGVLKINQQVMNDVSPKDRQLSMVFQSYALFPFLNVADNVAFGLKARKVAVAERRRRVDEALALVDLTKYRDRKPRELSGGQRQRVALARAIASDAKICLMDEPLSNLDAQLRVQMRSEIRQLQRKLGLTLIYVTHDQTEAMTMADHVMVLNDQHVQQIETPLGLYNQPANQFVAQFFGTPQLNLLPAICRDSETKPTLVVADTIQVTLTTSIPAGTYTVGIRPNQLAVTAVTTPIAGNATVVNVEVLGDQTIVAVVMDNGAEVRIVKNGQAILTLAQRVTVTALGPVLIFGADQTLIMAQGGSSDDQLVTLN